MVWRDRIWTSRMISNVVVRMTIFLIEIGYECWEYEDLLNNIMIVEVWQVNVFVSSSNFYVFILEMSSRVRIIVVLNVYLGSSWRCAQFVYLGHHWKPGSISCTNGGGHQWGLGESVDALADWDQIGSTWIKFDPGWYEHHYSIRYNCRVFLFLTRRPQALAHFDEY